MLKAVSPREACAGAAIDRDAVLLPDLVPLAQAAAHSGAFLDQAARVLVEHFDAERGLVMVLQGIRWEVVARFGRLTHQEPDVEHGLMTRLEDEKQVVWHPPLPNVKSALAVPIFDSRREVAAALCGIGGTSAPPDAETCQRLELLAGLVGLGLLRQDREAEIKRLRAQLEQMLSSKLAWELQRNPRLFDMQEQEVSVLFCDIADFSPVAERLGAQTSCRLVAEAMDLVTARIGEFEGSVVDYYGDGVLAMWNAPTAQADHAARACRAALSIQAQVPPLAKSWRDVVGAPLKLRCALNSGPVLVGNTGSRMRVKYGPIGHTVNLAHRVQAAGKHFGLPVLLTGNTRAMLDDSFATRRLCRAQLPGICNPVELFELRGENAPASWLSRRDAYEHALTLFEAGHWNATCRALHQWLDPSGDQTDLACLQLAARAIDCLKSRPAKFSPVWELAGK